MDTKRSERRQSDDDAATNLPGLGELRAAVANPLGPHVPRRATLRNDALAGLSGAISNVPDGMANAVIVGVNPVYGLYATMVGPAVGGIVSSTRLMMITTTAAASLSTSQALGGLTGEARTEALFLLVALVGVFQAAFGLLGFGRLIRFVSYSVTTGFLTGIAVLLILNQLPVVTGYEAEGDHRIAQTLDLFANLGRIDFASLALAALTLLLAVFLPRTRIGNLGRLVAVVAPSAIVAIFGLGGVDVVRDVGDIPRGVPLPALPALSALTPDVVTGALAVATIVLVQGSGVSQSVPNPDGARRSTSRDFVAQGAANVAAGFFRGLPVGGSMSATALNVVYGARSRWAAILAGLWMAVIVVAIPGLVAAVAMPALGALLILAGVSSVKLEEMRSIWRIGRLSRVASVVTFVATLALSIQAAVTIGVVLSAVLYVTRSSTDISIVRVVRHPDGRVEERAAPKRLPSRTVTVLDVYGHLFYAGARTLERLLPDPSDAERPVVVLRLRGRTTVGATLVDVLSGYADKLQAAGGRLFLSGVGGEALDRLARAGRLRLIDEGGAYEATAIVGESTGAAVAAAEAWLADSDRKDPAVESPPEEVSR